MDEYNGVLKVDYLGRVIEIPYTMSKLGGNARIYFQDVKGGYHSFFRRGDEWLYGLNKGPGWRRDFLELLYAAFYIAAIEHRL